MSTWISSMLLTTIVVLLDLISVGEIQPYSNYVIVMFVIAIFIELTFKKEK